MSKEFVGYPKIPRLTRDMIVTEKLDGTNAQIYITAAHEIGPEGLSLLDPVAEFQETYALGYDVYTNAPTARGLAIYAGSRNRWLTTEEDNFGFAKWVVDNMAGLFQLGPGRHFGEWYGRGIQRGYGLTERRFALFNTSRWNESNIPSCCSVVPVLMEGTFDTRLIDICVDQLRKNGSVAVPGYPNPEGVIVYHKASDTLFKKTLENDESPKTKNGPVA